MFRLKEQSVAKQVSIETRPSTGSPARESGENLSKTSFRHRTVDRWAEVLKAKNRIGVTVRQEGVSETRQASFGVCNDQSYQTVFSPTACELTNLFAMNWFSNRNLFPNNTLSGANPNIVVNLRSFCV